MRCKGEGVLEGYHLHYVLRAYCIYYCLYNLVPRVSVYIYVTYLKSAGEKGKLSERRQENLICGPKLQSLAQ